MVVSLEAIDKPPVRAIAKLGHYVLETDQVPDVYGRLNLKGFVGRRWVKIEQVSSTLDRLEVGDEGCAESGLSGAGGSCITEFSRTARYFLGICPPQTNTAYRMFDKERRLKQSASCPEKTVLRRVKCSQGPQCLVILSPTTTETS